MRGAGEKCERGVTFVLRNDVVLDRAQNGRLDYSRRVARILFPSILISIAIGGRRAVP